jgi:hypothetical protein
MSFFTLFGRTKKYITGILILAVIIPSVYFSFPEKTEAFWITWNIPGSVALPPTYATGAATGVSAANNTVQTTLQGAQFSNTFALQPIAMMLAKIIIQDITASTVKWINSGFNGNPAFVQNPEQFFLNVGDQTAATYLSTTNSHFLNDICTPFSAKIRLALVQNYLATKTPNKCTIQSIVKNWTNFGTNFYDNGGWDGWFSMTQNDSNNPIGAYLQEKDSLNSAIGSKINHYSQQLNQGQGFLSWETCAGAGTNSGTSGTQGATRTICLAGVIGKGVNASPVSYPASLAQPVDSSCTQSIIQVYSNGQWVEQGSLASNQGANGIDTSQNSQLQNCPNGTQVNTPGSVIAQQLGITLGSPLQQLGVAQSINQIVGALMTQMIKSVVGGFGTGGLSGLSQSSAATQSLQSQLEANATTSSPQFQAVQNQITNTANDTLTQSANNASSLTNTATATISITLQGPSTCSLSSSCPDGSDPSNPILWPLGAVWNDPGAIAADSVDSSFSNICQAGQSVDCILIGGDIIDTSIAGGPYTITYNATDSQGVSAAQVTRTVSVVAPTTTP